MAGMGETMDEDDNNLPEAEAVVAVDPHLDDESQAYKQLPYDKAPHTLSACPVSVADEADQSLQLLNDLHRQVAENGRETLAQAVARLHHDIQQAQQAAVAQPQAEATRIALSKLSHSMDELRELLELEEQADRAQAVAKARTLALPSKSSNLSVPAPGPLVSAPSLVSLAELLNTWDPSHSTKAAIAHSMADLAELLDNWDDHVAKGRSGGGGGSAAASALAHHGSGSGETSDAAKELLERARHLEAMLKQMEEEGDK